MKIACKSFSLFLVFYFLMSSESLNANALSIQTEKYKVEVDHLLHDLAHPWALDFLPNGSILITERAGTLKLLSPEGELVNIRGVPEVWAYGQGGLLDVAVDPRYFKNNYIFLSFSEPSNDGRRAGTAIVRAELITEPELSLRDLKVIFSQNKKTSSRYHFGSRITFGPNGALFATIGDRGDRDRAQDPFDHAGSIIRINRDGSSPEENPFFSKGKGLPEIWSIGHRNPQGATWVGKKKSLWTVAHGARGGDELNTPAGGKNYGWPTISFGRHYSGQKIGEGTEKLGLEQPIFYWDPSIAPSGLSYYDGNAFPEWVGDFFVGSLKLKFLARLEIVGGKVMHEERLFEKQFGRIRDVRQGPDGYLYLLTDKNPGQLLRIRPTK